MKLVTGAEADSKPVSANANGMPHILSEETRSLSGQRADDTTRGECSGAETLLRLDREPAVVKGSATSYLGGMHFISARGC